MMAFSSVLIECDKDDRLLVYNEDKSILLYDYCFQQKNKTNVNFVMSKAKYLIARLQTTSNRLLTATFDLVLLDIPLLVTLQTPSPLMILGNQNNQFILESNKEKELTNDGIHFFI